MAKYFTQKMSSGKLEPITYYRAQSDHPTHDESGAFTQAAKSNYASFNHITEDKVEVGTFRSNQGVPTSGKVYQI